MAGDYRLAKPPVLDTNVPTNEAAYRPGDRRKYATSANGIIAVAATPKGHPPERSGIWAHVQTTDTRPGGSNVTHLAFHAQAHSVQEYASQWQVQAEVVGANTPNILARNPMVNSDLAAQRLGDYVYSLAYTAHDIPVPSLYATLGTLTIERIGPDGARESRLSKVIDTSGDATGSQTLCPLPGIGNHDRHETFVSDDIAPFVWSTSGGIQDLLGSGSIGNYTPYVAALLAANPNPYNGIGYTAFKDDGSLAASFGSAVYDSVHSVFNLSGQSGAYMQAVTLPTGTYGFGPFLVHPWSAKNYGPPELWYFLMNGNGTDVTFDIYRAVWGRNQYRRMANVALTDDLPFQSGSQKFPTRNPEGYAFDPDWYHPSKKVSTVGPFKDAVIWNKRISDQPPPFLDVIVVPNFRIMRDYNRIGQMHIVMANASALQ